jgi:hypothetical protein
MSVYDSDVCKTRAFIAEERLLATLPCVRVVEADGSSRVTGSGEN